MLNDKGQKIFAADSQVSLLQCFIWAPEKQFGVLAPFC